MTEYNIVFSKRRTIAISVNKDAEVVVKAPLGIKENYIEAFVQKHGKWIEKQKSKISERSKNAAPPLTSEEVKALKLKAEQSLPEYAARFSCIMNVKPTGIKITSAKARWGSCTSKNSLCFPYRIMLLPDELIECIVVHELAHIKIKNHSPRFYAYIERFMPDYKERAKRLKSYSGLL